MRMTTILQTHSNDRWASLSSPRNLQKRISTWVSSVPTLKPALCIKLHQLTHSTTVPRTTVLWYKQRPPRSRKDAMNSTRRSMTRTKNKHCPSLRALDASTPWRTFARPAKICAGLCLQLSTSRLIQSLWSIELHGSLSRLSKIKKIKPGCATMMIPLHIWYMFSWLNFTSFYSILPFSSKTPPIPTRLKSTIRTSILKKSKAPWSL